MTNLSKELCEICGIGYIIKCKHGEQFPQNCDCNYSCEECSAHQKIYPDFERPENFVKLLEIVSKKSSVSFCHNGTYFGCSIHYFIADIFEADIGTIPHNFLNTLLKQHLRNSCKPKLLEQLKQAIRETEWVYEN